MGYTPKEQRLQHANELLITIADGGRRFFYSDKTQEIAQFRIDNRGHIWYFDHYTCKQIYTHRPLSSKWRHFTGGGTLKDLVLRLRDYISRGHTLPDFSLGPWPDWYCEGDLWGYGDYMDVVRAKAEELGLRPKREVVQ